MELAAHKPIYQLAESIEIDAQRACLRQGGEERYLRQQAFDVLLYLVEQRQGVVSKDELNQKIWKDTAVTDAALSQCIFEIRKALGDDSRKPRFIKTVPKLGYRFVGCVTGRRNPANAAAAVETSATPVEVGLQTVAHAVVITTELAQKADPLSAGNKAWLAWPIPRQPLSVKSALLACLLAAIVLLCGASWVLSRPAITQAAGKTHKLPSRPFAAQTGVFTASFEATPPDSPINNTIGLSNGPATCNKEMAAIARFNPMGTIDARNGGRYAAVSAIPYAAGVTYRFRMVVNVPSHTYSLYVTPAGETEQTVGTDFAFRSGQDKIPTLNSLGVWGTNGGAGLIRSFSINPGT